MTVPHVVVQPPAHWVAAEVEKPTIGAASGAVFAEWSAWREPGQGEATNGALLVRGCVATPIPGWVDDMRPAVEARTVALVGAQASKILAGPADLRLGSDETWELRAASNPTGPILGRARTFVGFDESRVFTCLALCAPAGPGTATHACGASVLAARLDGSLAPPRPGILLRGATWAVHHPRPAALGGFGLVTLLGILAVAARRRPRSTISRIG